MEQGNLQYYIFCKTYRLGRVLSEERVEVWPEKSAAADFLNGCCRAELIWEDCGQKQPKPWLAGKLAVSFLKDSHAGTALGVEIVVNGWKREHYLFLPGAVYNGNRMQSKRLPYPPFYVEPDKTAMEAAPVITDIPHLDIEAQQSEISILSGDMTTPAMGVYCKEEREGSLFFGRHTADIKGEKICEGARYTGFTARENLKEEKLSLSYTFPGVREEKKYFFGEMADQSGFYPDAHAPSLEEGRYFKAGENWELPFVCNGFASDGLEMFFRRFNVHRYCLEKGCQEPSVPFSRAYLAVKEKYLRENYIEEKDGGYFAVGTRRDVPQQCWQAGWIGGGMNNLPFLLEDKKEAFSKAVLTFRFILDHLQQENGWIVGIYAEGCTYGDAFGSQGMGDVLLVRKNADLLYFLLKEYLILREKKLLQTGDEEKIQRLCDAFVRLFEKYGQLGQFINIRSEEMIVAHSASAAIASGALALACQIWGTVKYLLVAEELGIYYAKNYLWKGILNGGPGEIAQAADSEAAFGLLESFVQLYETTGELLWLELAENACELAVTWVMSYDFTFPEDSTAAKRGARSAGTVFANAQNKHSAPGICTLSGNSLLKLYRFTGKEKYLDWLGMIAHSITQFVSLREHPVAARNGEFLPEGYMNERVQTSDWEGSETVGEFLYGSNWPEVSMLLTYVEVPGIYVDFSGKLLRIFDHIICKSAVWEEIGLKLLLYNPTEYEALVTVLIDEREEKSEVTHNYFDKMEQISLASGETKNVVLRRIEIEKEV